MGSSLISRLRGSVKVVLSWVGLGWCISAADNGRNCTSTTSYGKVLLIGGLCEIGRVCSTGEGLRSKLNGDECDADLWGWDDYQYQKCMYVAAAQSLDLAPR